MTRPQRPCSHPGCPALTTQGGRCPAHQRSTAEPRPAGYYRAYPRAWRRLSAALLAEHPTCQRCGAPSSCVDHVVPLAQGGTHDQENLQALCSRCHADGLLTTLGASDVPLTKADLAARLGKKERTVDGYIAAHRAELELFVCDVDGTFRPATDADKSGKTKRPLAYRVPK